MRMTDLLSFVFRAQAPPLRFLPGDMSSYLIYCSERNTNHTKTRNTRKGVNGIEKLFVWFVHFV
jgi:hypothetical protein